MWAYGLKKGLFLSIDYALSVKSFLDRKSLSMPCVAIKKIVTYCNYFNALALPGIRSITVLCENSYHCGNAQSIAMC